MENPWVDLPREPPYILPGDRDALGQSRDHGLGLDVLPAPFTGSPQRAELYLLALNPGLDADEVAQQDQNPYLAEQNRRGLTFGTTYPFWKLDPALAETSGYKWWTLRLKRLADQVGWDFVRESVMCVQYFPYHSRTFSASGVRLPSQQFTFQLVRDAVAAGKLVLIMRSRKLWTNAVPELAEHPCYELRNAHAVFVTQGNVVRVQPGFDDLIRRLRNGR